DRRIDRPVADREQCLTERDRAGRARVGRRQDRATEVEGDAEVRRRCASEDREREIRRDRTDAALEVPLVLALGVRDAPERAAEVDAEPLTIDAVGVGAAVGGQARVAERLPPGDEAEL